MGNLNVGRGKESAGPVHGAHDRLLTCCFPRSVLSVERRFDMLATSQQPTEPLLAAHPKRRRRSKSAFMIFRDVCIRCSLRAPRHGHRTAALDNYLANAAQLHPPPPPLCLFSRSRVDLAWLPRNRGPGPPSWIYKGPTVWGAKQRDVLVL